MKTTRMWLVALIFLAFAAVSCDNEEDPVNEAMVLAEYLEGADGGYAATTMPAIMKADGVKTLMATGGVYVIDIRSSADFSNGHIEGAVNVPSTEVLSHIEAMDDADSYEKIAIVCYTGQTAGWVTSICQISGYDNVFSMKWGMSSWNAEFNKVTSNTSNMYSALFTTTAYPMGPEGDLPVLNTGEENGDAILDAQISDVLAEGFGAAAITAAEVYANLDDYYIVNYWPVDHYNDPGHIEGAIQYTPKVSLGLDSYLKTLPTDKTVVVYCYSGQTSANMAAYLRVLGYDAKTLKFGGNGMIYDEMPGGKWSEDEIFGYDYVTAE